ncbi:Voltage-dependent anion-selective channel [Orchesella cincta]|uniref:Voltage-dependent anion-selective channel n=1 Tax=Orchesella cincta TaxID=48709 RepID=A0A1D2MF57_ORCCI|nr:Voltage-dependent anion-selective channel [Orchesella cincta]
MCEMAPPSYSDLGKACRLQLRRVQAQLQDDTVGGVDISTGGHHSLEEGKVFGDLETKYKWPSHGITITEKWNTNNLLVTEITSQDKLAPGAKVSLEGTFSPDSGKKSGKLKGQYKTTNATLDCTVDGADDSSLLVNGSMVLGYQGWLGGYQMTFDTVAGILKKNNFSAGYSAVTTERHSAVVCTKELITV